MTNVTLLIGTAKHVAWQEGRRFFVKKTMGPSKQPPIRTIIIVMAECGAAW